MSSLGFLGPFGHLILDAMEDINLPHQQLARPLINPTVYDISIRMCQRVRKVRAKFISHSVSLMHPKMLMAELVEECFLGQVRLNLQHLDTAFTAIIPDVLPRTLEHIAVAKTTSPTVACRHSRKAAASA